jgi:hypothetical protein
VTNVRTNGPHKGSNSCYTANSKNREKQRATRSEPGFSQLSQSQQNHSGGGSGNKILALATAGMARMATKLTDR